MSVPFDPVIPFLRLYPKEINLSVHLMVCKVLHYCNKRLKFSTIKDWGMYDPFIQRTVMYK